MFILAKLTCRVNVISFKMPMQFFTYLERILNIMWEINKPWNFKTVLNRRDLQPVSISLILRVISDKKKCNKKPIIFGRKQTGGS